MLINDDTIASLATPNIGSGAISVIRISGKNSISIVEDIFISVKPGKKLDHQSTHTIHMGFLVEKVEEKVEKENFLDQVLISVFKTPFSYTGENMIEISCHGSYYIQQKILQLLIKKGIRLAKPGEFTLRAFLNKKIDLSQAEAIADLISSENKVFHDISLQQIKGSLSNTIKHLRNKLLDFASILELELDFSEENLIIFSDRFDVSSFFDELKKTLKDLIESFSLGNAIKRGIIVAIVGSPNVGKSTLFNSIIKEERSIISDKEGTTRDCIEGEIIFNGILFRFMDTAGIRKSKDPIEIIGVEKTMKKIEESEVILYVFDFSSIKSKNKILDDIHSIYKKYPSKNIFIVANKSDLYYLKDFKHIKSRFSHFFEVSAKNNHGIDEILRTLSHLFIKKLKDKNVIVTQSRHYEALKLSLIEICLAHDGLINKGLSEDLISIHIKEALRYLGEITGETTNEDILKNIFSKFCIGK